MRASPTTPARAMLAFLTACCASGCAGNPERTHEGALTLTVENDKFTGTDNNYTNGVGVSWATAELDGYERGSFARKWLSFWSFLPGVHEDGHRSWASWTILQEMHTPDDITNPDPPLDDQPYAGILALDSTIHAREGNWGHTWNLRVGIVGPSSQADRMQEEFHEMIGADAPMGWDTQLPDELILNLDYLAACRMTESELGGSASWRLVSLGGASLGNYFTGASLGAYGEIGWNLVDCLGTSALRQGLSAAATIGAGPQECWSLSFFGGAGAYGVVHYLPLDGTLFHDSRSVDSNPLVGLVSAGMSLRHGRFVLGLGRSYYTETFEGQREPTDFGTLSLSWYF